MACVRAGEPVFFVVVRKLLDQPVVGFVPWIAMSILAGPDRLVLAAAVAFALALATIALGIPVGVRPKLLDVVAVAFFGVLAVVAALASDATSDWLERWSSELSNIAIMLIALGSIAFRVPFTIQYAREQTPEGYWQSPLFLRINYVLTWVWSAAFFAIALAGWIGDGPLDDPDNVWTSWLVQIGVLILAIRFTEWYPDHEAARDERSRDGTAPEPRSVADLLLPLAGYLPLVGVIVLIVGGTPWWLGVALIVLGGYAARALREAAARTGGSGDGEAGAISRRSQS